MHGTICQGGVDTPAGPESVARALAAGAVFWLDLTTDASQEPRAGGHPGLSDGEQDVVDLLEQRFDLHPLVVDRADRFGQRPTIDEYEGVTFMVAHGADPDQGPPTEVHFIVSDAYVITVHRGRVEALERIRPHVRERLAAGGAPAQGVIVYRVVDALNDSFFPALSAFDDRIDDLEDAILRQPTEQQLADLFDMKRQLLSMRKVITPQRDMFATLSGGVEAIPGLDERSAPYLRDLYDHLIRLSDMVDSYRDLLGGVMDTHISTVSNRLNVVMKQLTIIATVFLPLSFLTGFFGQNFAVLVRWIGGGLQFWLLGIGLEVAAALGLFVMFKRRGWLGGPSE